MMQGWYLIIGSGPSLTRADCDLVRGVCKTIAVNNAVYFAPWADYLYAGDRRWWVYHNKNVSWFKGERVSHQKFENNRRFNRSHHFARFGANSGHHAVQFAATDCHARGIALLGFDHKYSKMKKHFHGDHPKPLGNAHHVDHWPKIMARTAKDLERMQIPVLNLTRDTALNCFDQITVEDFIASS